MEVRDAATGTVLFAQGFASIFGEWMTTAEAKTTARGFDESVRFPEPAGPVDVSIARRGPDGAPRSCGRCASIRRIPSVDRAAPPAGVRVWAVQENGPPAEKVDLLLIGDGYTAAERDKWHGDAERLAEALFAESPFRERRRDFNVWADRRRRRTKAASRAPPTGSSAAARCARPTTPLAPSATSSPSTTRACARWRRPPPTTSSRSWSTTASTAAAGSTTSTRRWPRTTSSRPTSSCTSSAITSPASATSTTRRPTSTRPPPAARSRDPNVTADPQAAKWKDLVAAGTPLPTPWPKEEFERGQKAYQERRQKIRAEERPEAEMEALFREEKARSTALLGPAQGKVGRLRGRAVRVQRLLPPGGGLHHVHPRRRAFCAVCRRAIEATIDRYAPRPASAR